MILLNILLSCRLTWAGSVIFSSRSTRSDQRCSHVTKADLSYSNAVRRRSIRCNATCPRRGFLSIDSHQHRTRGIITSSRTYSNYSSTSTTSIPVLLSFYAIVDTNRMLPRLFCCCICYRPTYMFTRILFMCDNWPISRSPPPRTAGYSHRPDVFDFCARGARLFLIRYTDHTQARNIRAARRAFSCIDIVFAFLSTNSFCFYSRKVRSSV